MFKRLLTISSIACLAIACQNKKTLFKQLPSSQTHIDFQNTIIESDSINVMDFENVYNGGGVGFGDFNNDGLQDIYFTGNMVSNKLYLNKGKMTFEDITTEAQVGGMGRWCRGVSVVDINNDGWMDIYLSASVKKNPAERENLLYVNQGLDKNQKPVFKEMAAEYGLNDTTHSTMASFFDYDNDGDLDVFICVNHIIQGDFPNRFRPRNVKGEHPSTGRLYQNNWSDSLRHPVFSNVSAKAGITIEGYSHNVMITDINRDGWKDIYVTNDYLSQNVLYINNQDGTFTDRVTEYFKHTSANAMGSDIIDINNDGLSDVIELDMNPEDNYRKKMMLNANSYQTYQNSDQLGYQYQYVRNTLQLNRGNRVTENDSIGAPVFSDISYFAGVAETDWSWTPMVADFDNDGQRDMIITNGFPKDVTDHDFVAYRKEAFAVASSKQLLDQIPEVRIHNYGFHNNGDLTFSDRTQDWGLTAKTFSNGAAYADLDNDGDLDFVVNNINDEALVYENTLSNENKAHNYVRFSLKGDAKNIHGIGAWINIYYQGKMAAYEQIPYRGYLSTMQLDPQFGVDSASQLDSVVVWWPGNLRQVLKEVPVNQQVVLDISKAITANTKSDTIAVQALFREITRASGLQFSYEERDFVDFNIQKLLPHKYSEAGPALAVADLDGNQLDDILISGSYGHSAMMFLQQPHHRFVKKELIGQATDFTKPWEDAGIVLFDADNDQDIDIYISSGGYENPANGPSYGDKLYVNDGKANFSIDTSAIPSNYTSKSSVRAADFDQDGDLDLLIAGRVEPWMYPKPVSSFIYRNDSQNGKPHFTDVTATVAPALKDVGLISDAIWTDFDNDDWLDIILAGEWMPVTFLKNNKGTFTNVTGSTGLDKMLGWWRSILPGDFDNDGDIDYVVGNAGRNSFYKASEQYPVRVYAKDFDKNGSYDAVPTLYLPSTLDNQARVEYPAQTRDDIVKQMIGFRAKFQNYKTFASAPFEKMFSPEELKGARIVMANNFSHVLIKNNGNGRFESINLPIDAQFSCLNGMVAEDVDGDGKLDLAAVGNDYGTEVSVGRYDACNGLLMKGDGKGGFVSLSMMQSGVFIPGNAHSMVSLAGSDGQWLIAAGQNRGPLKLFECKQPAKMIKISPLDVSAIITFTNGEKQKRELNYGASYLSQSSRMIVVPPSASAIEVTDHKGVKRKISF